MATTSPYSYERRVAELAVLRASILTKEVQSSVKQISKEDDEPVTVADFAAQAIITGTLHHAFPQDGFLGEETSKPLRADRGICDKVFELVNAVAESTATENLGIAIPKPSSVEEMLSWIDLGGSGRGGRKGRFWVMDPVDGTAAFLKGQQYAVALALVEDGKEVIGTLGCPNISPGMTRISEHEVDTEGFGIMLIAVHDQGVTLKSMTAHGLLLVEKLPLKCPKAWTPGELHIVGCTSCKVTCHDPVARLAEVFQAKFPNTEIWSSHIRYAAMVVGGGSAQFWIPAGPSTKIHTWDHAGSQLIYTELGGIVTDLNGKPVDFGAGRDLDRNEGLVVARGDLHQSVLAAIQKIVGKPIVDEQSRVFSSPRCEYKEGIAAE